MQWGGFASSHLPVSEFDASLDAESSNPGSQVHWVDSTSLLSFFPSQRCVSLFTAAWLLLSLMVKKQQKEVD